MYTHLLVVTFLRVGVQMQSLIHIKEGYSADYLHHGFASDETSVVEDLRKYLCHSIFLHSKWMHCWFSKFHTNKVLRLLRWLSRNNCVKYILLNILLPFIKYSCLIFAHFNLFCLHANNRSSSKLEIHYKG